MNPPTAMAREGAHDKVEELLRDCPRGALLDVPAGQGALALRLKGLGYDVCACDLYPEIFNASDIEIRSGNLDVSLEYADRSFDYVVCVEGLEHIENPSNAIREFARVLRDGGVLILSVPNIMNIEERLKWLFAGYTSHFRPLSKETRAEIANEYGGMEEVALHINPIGYSEVRYLLEKNGFELESVCFDTAKSRALLFWPLVMLIRLTNRLTPPAKRRARWTDELNSNELLRGGNTLIFKAKKS